MFALLRYGARKIPIYRLRLRKTRLRFPNESRHLLSSPGGFAERMSVCLQRAQIQTEYKVEAAHRVIDLGRSITVVARKLGVLEVSLGNWVRAECRRIEAAR